MGCFGRTQATVILQVSAAFHYTYDTRRAVRQPHHGDDAERLAASILATTYRVAMNNFLADGGDGFPGFKAGTNRVNQPGFDVDALAQYLGAHTPPGVAPGPQDRITEGRAEAGQQPQSQREAGPSARPLALCSRR